MLLRSLSRSEASVLIVALFSNANLASASRLHSLHFWPLPFPLLPWASEFWRRLCCGYPSRTRIASQGHEHRYPYLLSSSWALLSLRRSYPGSIYIRCLIRDHHPYLVDLLDCPRSHLIFFRRHLSPALVTVGGHFQRHSSPERSSCFDLIYMRTRKILNPTSST